MEVQVTGGGGRGGDLLIGYKNLYGYNMYIDIYK